MNVFVLKMSRTKDGVNLGMMIRKTFVFFSLDDRFECTYVYMYIFICVHVYMCTYVYIHL